MSNVTAVQAAVLAIELAPMLAFGLAAERIGQAISRWHVVVRVAAPSVLVVPYLILAISHHMLRWEWCVLYALLPVAMAWLMQRAAAADPEQRGNWRDALILLTLGLAVDLRWFDRAWPAGLRG